MTHSVVSAISSLAFKRWLLALFASQLWLTSVSVAENPPGDLLRFLQVELAKSSAFTDRFEAEVWLLDSATRLAPFMPDHDARLHFLRELHRASQSQQLHPEIVMALIEVESHFDRFAVSKAGAQGFMQVMPLWKDTLGRPQDNLLLTPVNLRYGCAILRFYLNRESGNLRRALAAYNGSLGSNTYSDKVYSAWSRHWRTQDINWDGDYSHSE